jgi:hypothetical protein
MPEPGPNAPGDANDPARDESPVVFAPAASTQTEEVRRRAKAVSPVAASTPPSPSDTMPPAASSHAVIETTIEDTANERFTLVIGDTEGDVAILKKNLRLVGLLDEDGNIDKYLLSQVPMTLIDEGDAIRKKTPDGRYLMYRQKLLEEMTGQGRLVALAGNHEMERLQSGLTPRQAKLMQMQGLDPIRVLKLIKGLDVFHLAPPLLYLHGYPTLGFLRLLWKKYLAKAKDPSLLNEEFRASIQRGGKAIDNWSYRRENGKKHLLHDVGNADKYYAATEKEIASLCENLGVHTIVIGHRPCARRIQEAHVLMREGGKKAQQDAKKLHDSLVHLIAAGKPITVDGQWGPNGEVVILRNDVLGKFNKNEYGMLLLRQRECTIDILPINAYNQDRGQIRAFMGLA